MLAGDDESLSRLADQVDSDLPRSAMKGAHHAGLRPLDASWPAVALGVVGNESAGVIFSVGASARQPASSSLVLAPTSFVSAPSLSVSKSFAIEPSER